MKFVKMQCAGNDYVYITEDEAIGKDYSRLAAKIAKKHFGIGSDGLVVIGKDGEKLTMRMFNADGSEGMMCGNAAICIGKYAVENGLCDSEFVLETASGDKKTEYADGVTKVAMGVPCFLGNGLIFAGNTHRVLFVEEPEKFPLEKIAAAGGDVNTDVAAVIDENTVVLRTHERGSGETFACGSGACATVFSAVQRGLLSAGKDICVKSKGGALTVRLENNGEIYLSGKAVCVFEGEYLCE